MLLKYLIEFLFFGVLINFEINLFKFCTTLCGEEGTKERRKNNFWGARLRKKLLSGSCVDNFLMWIKISSESAPGYLAQRAKTQADIVFSSYRIATVLIAKGYLKFTTNIKHFNYLENLNSYLRFWTVRVIKNQKMLGYILLCLKLFE